MEDFQAESEARRLLTAAYDSVPDGGPADGELLSGVRRHARRTRARAGLAGGSAVAVVGGAAAIFLAAMVPAAPSALAAVTSAVTKTSGAGFRVNLTMVDRNGGGPDTPFRMTGEFNPKQGVGEETISNGFRMRFTGGHAYLSLPHLPKGSKPWGEQRIIPTSDLSAASLAWDYNSDQPVDPALLLGLLKSAATLRDEGPVSGPGWSGTRYAFVVRHPASIVESMTGTLSVDSDGQLRQLDQTVTFTPDPAGPGKPDGPAQVETLDFSFSDFGTQVRVAAPPAGQVDNMRGAILGAG